MHALEQPYDDSAPVVVDQRVMFHGITWSHYQALLGMRGEKSVPRISYLEGKVELMSPSRYHERIKTTLARLVEHYAVEMGLPLNGYGSWTLEDESEEAGAEADECYCLGPPGDLPDLAIEVIWTHGGLDKLEIYRRLGVREVWIWKRKAISVHLLGDDGYHEVGASLLLPELDLKLIAELCLAEDQLKAIRSLNQAIRSSAE